MSRQREIDREALHRVLWRRCDRRGALKLVQNEMAMELGITPSWFSRIVAEFREQGIMTPIASGKHNVKTYRVTEPPSLAATD